jgi:hypothetical protein
MITKIRLTAYQIFRNLAGIFIDRQIKAHAPQIFDLVDRELWNGGKPNPVKDRVLQSLIMAATGLASVDDNQVQQVRDLFDPVAFAEKHL